MNDDIHNSLSDMVGDQTEQTTFAIWASAISVTRAFEKVEVKIAPEANRIFVVIHLKWWAKIKWKKFNIIRQIWLNKAIRNVKQTAPQGWNVLTYYDNKK